MSFFHIMYFVWAAVFVAFVAVMVYRGYLSNHETSQLFLSDNSDDSLAESHHKLVRRASRVDPLFTGLGGATALVSALIIGVYLVQQIPHMRF